MRSNEASDTMHVIRSLWVPQLNSSHDCFLHVYHMITLTLTARYRRCMWKCTMLLMRIKTLQNAELVSRAGKDRAHGRPGA